MLFYAFKMAVAIAFFFLQATPVDRCEHNSTYTTTSRYNFMLFYAFKMAVAIAFLRENAVEAI